MKKHVLLLPALAAAAALALAGCASSPSQGSTPAADGLSVVATTTQVADFTREVAGSAASVTQLIQPNQSAHSYDPSPADLAALGSADVLVVNGAGLEEWLDDAISASGFDGVTIDSSTGIALTDDAADEEEHEEGHDEGHDDETAHTDDDAHDHAAGNPHIWTDPSNAVIMVQNIADGLEKAGPAQEAAFAANASAYQGRLTELDDWIRSNIDQVPAEERLLVSNHDAFGYFVSAYGITYVGSIIPSFDDNAEPSAAEIDALVAKVKQTGVKAIFSEASISPKAADTIAAEAGVKVYSGDEALYGDSLGPAGSDGATYIASQLHNATVILSSWGATPSAVPADLED
ncbi:metal ABC transporter substrate-binding protein [Herbiconiux daphne]|uniref:Metal ABC transporter substrate-binding protein n=1 Tax=Herbiconiux daphne TaxID=2970914 RepID=A0ABT2H688_9MICO|nr:metal ABC transporter substrate-binding protein [Herbiconiux daphne]MCS5735409.1 metal ABC transporter substrate-binding protein [Herbiconiux daphne]